MIGSDSSELTLFERALIDFVRFSYCQQFPRRISDSLRWCKIQKGPHRSLFFFYAQGGRHPIFFAKTSSRGATSFQKEFKTLNRLHEEPTFAASVPEVIGLIEEGDCCAIAEKAVAGHLFAPVRVRQFLKRREVRSHIDGVFTWWKKLVELFPDGDGKESIAIQVELVRNAFLERYGATETYSHCLEILARVERFCLAGPVLSVVHGDLWRENIFRRGKEVFVFDWERADMAGLPLLDLLLFLSTLIDDNSESGMVEVFWGSSWLPKVVSKYLDSACKSLKLSRGEAEDLFYFFLFMMSSQVMRLFRVKTEWDRNWCLRLECALRNRESVRMLFCGLPH